jgi:transposase
LDLGAQGPGTGGLGGKRLRAELILAAALSDQAPPSAEPAWWLDALGLAEFLPDVPEDTAALLALLPHADVYVQDEVQTALHPTLTRAWSRRGRRGQRLVRTPGRNQKFVGFGAVDWREGELCFGFSPRRDAQTFCLQLDALVERSTARGRVAIVLTDNAGTHRPEHARRVQETLARHGNALRLVYTPAYDPQANPLEQLWRVWRRQVSHNHAHEDFWALVQAAEEEVERLQAQPDAVLRHIGSPGVAPLLTTRAA